MLFNKIMVSKNLVSRGIALESLACPLCNVDEEEMDHIFFNCDFAAQI